jgi:hypothetical protein
VARDKQAAAAAAAAVRSARARDRSAELGLEEAAAAVEPVGRRLELPTRELHRVWMDNQSPRRMLVRA